jgi:hypothetical protein
MENESAEGRDISGDEKEIGGRQSTVYSASCEEADWALYVGLYD